MSRPFEARYYGRCVACDERTEPGDMLVYEDDDAIHEDCAGRSLPEPVQQKPCPSCWLVGPCDCEADR